MAQINKPSDYFNTVLYTGNGSTNNITGVEFQPDLVWIKNRTVARDSRLQDAVRGVSKSLISNTTDAEYNDTTSNFVTSFNSDGFSVGGHSNVNESGSAMCSWNWLANGTGVSNTDGTITSTVSANTTSGFSIVSWTGDGSASSTVGHGLGSSGIDMIITKNRDNASSVWYTKHKDLSSDNVLLLDSTTGQFSNIGSTWGGLDNLSASSVFGFDAGSSGVRANLSGEKQIAYCFKSVKGFSKFGKYTGNGNSSNGTFVYTGFKPAFILLKRTDAVANWFMFDIKRNTYNTLNNYLWSNSSQAEAVGGTIDFYSNGFKLFTSWTEMNASGGTYIYMAFAENPLVGTNNIPTTAR